MNYSNTYSPLHFYTSVDSQHQKKWYAYGRTFPVACLKQYLPPFQVIRAVSVATITILKLHSLDDGSVIDISSDIGTIGITIEGVPVPGTYSIIKHPGDTAFSTAVPVGQYYVEMSDGTNTWFSEVIGFRDVVSKCLKITWWNDEIMGLPNGQISFTNYKNFYYLDTELGKPLYPYNRKIQERAGYQFKIFQVSMKVFRFSVTLPEHQIDAIRLATIAHHVEIESNGVLYTADDVLMLEPEWNPEGDAAFVTFELRCDTIVTSTSAANSSTGSPWLLPGGDDAWLL